MREAKCCRFVCVKDPFIWSSLSIVYYIYIALRFIFWEKKRNWMKCSFQLNSNGYWSHDRMILFSHISSSLCVCNIFQHILMYITLTKKKVAGQFLFHFLQRPTYQKSSVVWSRIQKVQQVIWIVTKNFLEFLMVKELEKKIQFPYKLNW
jgi:hypothetical protein